MRRAPFLSATAMSVARPLILVGPSGCQAMPAIRRRLAASRDTSRRPCADTRRLPSGLAVPAHAARAGDETREHRARRHSAKAERFRIMPQAYHPAGGSLSSCGCLMIAWWPPARIRGHASRSRSRISSNVSRRCACLYFSQRRRRPSRCLARIGGPDDEVVDPIGVVAELEGHPAGRPTTLPSMPASSRASRTAAAFNVSPDSTWPLGKIQLLGFRRAVTSRIRGPLFPSPHDDGARLLELGHGLELSGQL